MLSKALEFLNSPVEHEFFTKFVAIYARNSDGVSLAVKLESKKWSLFKSNREVNYCDKIKVGETLSQALIRALWETFNLKLIDFEVIELAMDTAKNKQGEEISRIPIVAYVEAADLKYDQVVGCGAEWIDRTESKLNANNPEVLGWLKSHEEILEYGTETKISRDDMVTLVVKLYELGAVDIVFGEYVDEVEQIPVSPVTKPNSLEIRLPKNLELRREIIKEIDLSPIGVAQKNKLEVDLNQDWLSLGFEV